MQYKTVEYRVSTSYGIGIWVEYSYLIGWNAYLSIIVLVLVLVLVLVQDSTESWGGVGKKKKGNGSNIGRFFGGVHYKIIKKKRKCGK